MPGQQLRTDAFEVGDGEVVEDQILLLSRCGMSSKRFFLSSSFSGRRESRVRYQLIRSRCVAGSTRWRDAECQFCAGGVERPTRSVYVTGPDVAPLALPESDYLVTESCSHRCANRHSS